MGSYIRDRREEKTVYQESRPLTVYTDFGQDVTCVYGMGPGFTDRIRQFRERGYVIHLMTGIAWGGYDDFVYGRWDGIDHSDVIQRERSGAKSREFSHNYYVPTIPYVNYLIERMKLAVDAGVEAIHVEEPEYLGESGYSEAFKREFKLYYHTDWVAPHTSVDARYKCSKLMAYLYRRAIDRASSEIRDYGLSKYNRIVRFYVPTHSLLNYTQWNVLSPEGTLTDIPTLDGYKAQIWMGTTREENVFKGVKKERSFETGFMEYGVMQELVRGTGRDMWFDNDPIEDRPEYTWETYRINYIKTLVSSLLQPLINKFQTCPWPGRIFWPECRYPSNSPDATSIPADYATLLMNIFQMQGTFDTDDYEWARKMPNIGVLLSDSALFQRMYPDDVKEAWTQRNKDITAKYPVLNELADGDEIKYFESYSLPMFYGLAMPLIKGGLPVRPVQLENITRYPQYLDGYDCLVLSYEFMKPAGADVNGVLAEFVRRGGTLVYVGDGTDPFHKVESWWNTGLIKDNSPLEHLLRSLKLGEDCPDGIYNCEKGRFALMRVCPAHLTLDSEMLEKYISLMRELTGDPMNSNSFSLRRGAYTITAVMDECATAEKTVHEGLFADMLTSDMRIVTRKEVGPDEYAVLFDINSLPNDRAGIVGTGIRILDMTENENGVLLHGRGPGAIRINIRLRLPKAPSKCSITILPMVGEPGEPDYPRIDKDAPVTPETTVTWDELSQTALFSFDCTAGDLTMEIEY